MVDLGPQEPPRKASPGIHWDRRASAREPGVHPRCGRRSCWNGHVRGCVRRDAALLDRGGHPSIGSVSITVVTRLPGSLVAKWGQAVLPILAASPRPAAAAIIAPRKCAGRHLVRPVDDHRERAAREGPHGWPYTVPVGGPHSSVQPRTDGPGEANSSNEMEVAVPKRAEPIGGALGRCPRRVLR